MSDHRQVELRRWIQEVAAASEPIVLREVMNQPPIDRQPPELFEGPGAEQPHLSEPEWERRMNTRRASVILAAVAAIIAIGAFAVTRDDGPINGDIMADDSDTAAAAPPADEATTAPSPAEVATEFWQAIADNDWETALTFVDPDLVDSPEVTTFGRANTLEGQFDWYEAVDWQWRLEECVTLGDDAECTALATNAWSEALGVDPIPGTFVVEFGENGIIAMKDTWPPFAREWAPQVFNIFNEWVLANHPDDWAIMTEDVDVDPEILRVYEANTARFIEAQQEN